jgi:DNA-binding MarR family transcriptional regulator
MKKNAGEYPQLLLANQLCFPLYSASNAVVRAYRPLLDKLDITYLQYIVLMVLWQETQVSVKELGLRLSLDSGTLTPLLKRLECKGLVDRTRCVDDERVRIITITVQGEAL